MKINVTAIDRMTPEQLDAWSRFQRSDPALASPYFRPEFIRVASACREGVKVAAMEEDGKPAGFFPFQREGSEVGRPVAAPLSDFQGVVARPGLTWNAKELIHACGLSVWHFDHLVATQNAFASCHWVVAPSAYMDLSQGFEAYRQERHDAGYREISQAMRKMRKVENQLGPLRFETHTTDECAFQSMLRWKAQQYRRSNQTDVFQFPWVVELLRRILREQGEGFSGTLSALYAGDRLAAVHLGMRSHGVLHAWFPAYDPELRDYSPGTILFAELARTAASQGIHRIDLGKGPEAFKVGLGSGAIPVAEGFIDVKRFSNALRRGWLRTRDRVRRSPLRRPVAAVAALVRPWRARRMMR
jgi:CelD/BcsL family acetyltransferase involved in cellulose biosynthesis